MPHERGRRQRTPSASLSAACRFDSDFRPAVSAGSIHSAWLSTCLCFSPMRRMVLPPSSLTFHLQHLHRAGLVAQRRVGRQLIYAADFDRMRGLGH